MTKTPQPVPLNPQVPFAAGGSLGGYTIGKAVSTLLLFYVIGEAPGEVKLSIEFILEAGLGAIGAFLVPWLKGPPKE